MHQESTATQRARHRNARGLTLLELIVVMAIITILAGVAIPTISSYVENETSDESAERMKIIEDAVKQYAQDMLSVPASLDDLRSGSGDRWRGPYIPEYIQGWAATEPDFKNDNWGRPFQWSANGAVEGTLTCAGPDGAIGGDDDLVLKVDVRPILRSITLDRLKAINAAIVLYNQKYQEENPLGGDAAAVVSQLQSEGYLSSGRNWAYDAFGDLLKTDGSPVVALYSNNALHGYSPSGASDDGEEDDGDDHEDDHEDEDHEEDEDDS